MNIKVGDKIISAIYIESQSMKVQGKANDIYKRYGKEWNIKALGNVYFTCAFCLNDTAMI